MAGLTREQRAARAALVVDGATTAVEMMPEPLETEPTEPGAPTDDGLVAMTKHAEMLRVHPSCVLAHQKQGWTPQ